MTIPNALSGSRILAAPVLAHAVLAADYPTALGLLGYCAATDLVDGFLARRLGQESRLGSVLDPVGDKLLVGALVIPMTFTGLLPCMPVIVYIPLIYSATDGTDCLAGCRTAGDRRHPAVPIPSQARLP